MRILFKEIGAIGLTVLETAVVCCGITQLLDDVSEDALLVVIICLGIFVYINVQYILTLHHERKALQEQAADAQNRQNQLQQDQKELDECMAEEIHQTAIRPEEYSSLLTKQENEDAGKEQNL